MQTLARHFEEGGFGMYPVTFILALIVAIVCERAWVLWSSGRMPSAAPIAGGVLRRSGRVEEALGLMATLPGSMARIVEAGLGEARRPGVHASAAMEVARASEVARLQRRLGVLAMLAKVAFLAGLFGTIVGLILPVCCGAGGCSEAGAKATMLAKGISEAMNCNALGLLTAVLAYVAHHLLTRAVANRAAHLESEAASFHLELQALQPYLRLGGRPAMHTFRTYRGPLPSEA